MALGDVDGDGNLDAIFANIDNQRNRLCLGNGAGGFACGDLSADNNVTFGVALGDVDGNGDLDAVFSNQFQRNRVCLGDGAGNFNCADVSADNNSSQDLALGDVDQDGNLDAVFANFGQRNRVCLGDGAGGFNCADISADTNGSRGVALAPRVIAPPFLKEAAQCQKTIGIALRALILKIMRANSKCLDNEARGRECDTDQRDGVIAKALAQAGKKLDKQCSVAEYQELGFPENTAAAEIRDDLVQKGQDAAEGVINDSYVAGYSNKP